MEKEGWRGSRGSVFWAIVCSKAGETLCRSFSCTDAGDCLLSLINTCCCLMLISTRMMVYQGAAAWLSWSASFRVHISWYQHVGWWAVGPGFWTQEVTCTQHCFLLLICFLAVLGIQLVWAWGKPDWALVIPLCNISLCSLLPSTTKGDARSHHCWNTRGKEDRFLQCLLWAFHLFAPHRTLCYLKSLLLCVLYG